MKEAGVAAGLHSNNIRLIDPAETPDKPVSPNLLKSGSIGLFLGVLSSAAIIGFRESMNRELRDPAEVESFTSMPSLAVIPLRERPKQAFALGEGDAACLNQPRSAMAEAYRALGTSIMLASPRLKTLLVTSPLPNEGKTITAMNSAVVLAQQGKRVLLVDADLRKPALHRTFNLSNEFGLSSVLMGSVSDTGTINQHKRLPNLFLLAAGPAQPMAAELLGSARMREFMSAWREQYDYVIVDTPPMLAVTDAVRLSTLADSTLLIVRSGQTRREALARSCDRLNHERVPVLGIVVNGSIRVRAPTITDTIRNSATPITTTARVLEHSALISCHVFLSRSPFKSMCAADACRGEHRLSVFLPAQLSRMAACGVRHSRRSGSRDRARTIRCGVPAATRRHSPLS